MIDGQDRGGHDPGKAEQRADDDLLKLVNTYFVLATKSYLSRDHLFITGNGGVLGNQQKFLPNAQKLRFFTGSRTFGFAS